MCQNHGIFSIVFVSELSTEGYVIKDTASLFDDNFKDQTINPHETSFSFYLIIYCFIFNQTIFRFYYLKNNNYNNSFTEV